MQKPYKRAFGLYLVINLLLALSVTLPIAAIISHFRRSDLDGILGLWGMLIAVHMVITLVFIPSIATWLARKDIERAARLASRKNEKI